MIKSKLMAVLLGASLAACAATYAIGRVHQNSIYAKQIARAEMKGIQKAAELSAKLARTETELLKNQRLLEETAHADRSGTGTCLPASRVRRLNLR